MNPTGRRFATVLLPCVTLIAVLYAVAGVMGYLQFTNWTCPNISEAYTDDDFVFVGQIGVVLCITGGHPVNMFPLKIAIDKLLFFESAPSHLRRGVISAFCVLSAGAVALAIEDLSDVLSLTGALGSGPISFSLPAIAFMNTRHPDKPLAVRLLCTAEGWVSIVLTAFVVATIAVVTVNFATLGPADGDEPDFQCGAVCAGLPPGGCPNETTLFAP